MKIPYTPVSERRHARDPVTTSSVGGQHGQWAGLDEAWTYLSYIISGVAVWGLIGYGLDRWLSTKPVFFVIGALLGNFVGIYAVYVKAFRSDDATRSRRAT